MLYEYSGESFLRETLSTGREKMIGNDDYCRKKYDRRKFGVV